MEAVTVGVLVPAKHIAKVIGKSGAGLRQIREATGCKLQVQPKVDEEQEQESGTRRVDINGNIAQIIAAFQLLLFKAFPEEQSAPSLMIPADKAGQVVGRGGENLKKVREMCHVRISLEREPVVDPASGLEERLLMLQGDLIQMPAALRFVFGIAIAPLIAPGGGCGPMAAPMAMGAYGGVTPSSLGSGVRPPGSDPAEIQVHFSVPERLAGAILGKGGALVKQTAAAAGCRLSMTSRDAGGERRAVIIGTFEQCAAAQEMLRQQIEEAAGATEMEFGQVTVVFMIRREAAGAVIGKQGAGMQKIREQSGAKIHLAREEVEGQRPCTITGAFEAVMAAEKSIYELVREVPVEVQGPRGIGWGGAGGGFHDGMRQLEDESTTKLLVPTQWAGAVIGKQGVRLKEIRESTGAHVEMMQPSSAPQWPTDRMVILRGDARQRESAAQAVLRSAFQHVADTCTLKMLVSSSQAGVVIGKQGSTLKRIREHSGIGVQVDREEVFGERLISATGPLNHVLAAFLLLFANLTYPNALPDVAVHTAQPSSRALASNPTHQPPALAASYVPYLAPQPHLLAGQYAGQAFPPNITWPGY